MQFDKELVVDGEFEEVSKEQEVEIQNGIVLYMKENGVPGMSVLGSVNLTELTAMAKLISVSADNLWKDSLGNESKEG